ncbi:MAG: hypothetical protein R3E08_07910 [Thiotrichaceae bacterium]
MKRLSYGFIVLWLLSSLNVYAQSYYVSSSTGDDNNDGKTEATAENLDSLPSSHEE